MHEPINIVMASDENYLMPTYVAISSLFENSHKETKYRVSILVPGNIPNGKCEDFYSIAAKYKQEVVFVDMGDKFKGTRMSIAHITIPTYYRLYITEILRNCKKCIYLDSDIYVNGDLTELYNTDVDGYYIAGVPAIAYHLEKDGNRSLCDKLEIPSIDNYVNAGVLLFNIEEIRRNFKTKDFIDLVQNNYPSQDQDILNKLFYDKIRLIPLKYNSMMKYNVFGGEAKIDSPIFKVVSVQEVQEARINPIIIHYADRTKPWQDKGVLMAEYWWSFLDKIDVDYRIKYIDGLDVKGDFRKKTLSVFGSSTTTKILSLLPEVKIVNLVGRISIQSSVQKENEKINLVDLGIEKEIVDKWSLTMLQHDISKTAITKLIQILSDYIIIDTHEDRFGLVEIISNGEKSIITDSYLANKLLKSTKKIKKNAVINISEIDDIEYEQRVETFCNQIKKIFPEKSIIVNETLEPLSYMDKYGNIVPYNNRDEILVHNENSKRCFNALKKYLPSALFIPSFDNILGGIEPIAPDHFSPSYYYHKSKMIEKVIFNNSVSQSDIDHFANDVSHKNSIDSVDTEVETGSSEPEISIIIPTHNSENTIRECLNSAQNQTLKNIEIICVDDYSTDNTRNILKAYALRDSRIKVILFENNKGTSKARKDAILESSGKYIMFLDSDDYLETNACQYLLKIITTEAVDIVSFGANVISVNQPEEKVRWMTNFIKPKIGYLYGQDIFMDCFVNKNYSHILWNKIINADVCKKAIANVSDNRYIKGNDRYAYFFIALESHSYYCIDNSLYNYRLGSGISNEQNFTINQFEDYMTEIDICNEEENYLKINDYNVDYFESILIIKREIFTHMTKLWANNLDDSNMAYGLQLMIDKFGIAGVAYGVKNLHRSKIKKISKYLCENVAAVNNGDEVKTIGLFYHRLYNGGIERVISLLMPGLIKSGYKVVLFLEERNMKMEFEIPKDVKVILIPPSKNIESKNSLKHFQQLYLELIENEIDVFWYQASSSEYVLEDGFIARSVGCYFMITLHEIFSQPMVLRESKFIDKLYSFKIVNCIHTLNIMECTMWKYYGIPTVYMRNPLTFKTKLNKSSSLTGYNILWVGRLDDYQKCFSDAISAFSVIFNEIPNSRLYMLGKGVNNDVDQRVRKLVKESGLEGKIILPGYTTEVDDYYLNSDIFICTSAYETYPMSLSEAMSFGLPIVMYELPYLEVIRGSTCSISVEQKDTVALANAVIKLFNNREEMKILGQNGRSYINSLNDDQLFEDWKYFFEHKGEVQATPDENFINLMDTIMSHYSFGIGDGTITKQATAIAVSNHSISVQDIISSGIRYYKNNGLVKTIKKMREVIKIK